MSIDTLSKKRKLGRIRKIRNAPRWADLKKYGLKRARTRRINIDKIKKWRRIRIKV